MRTENSFLVVNIICTSIRRHWSRNLIKITTYNLTQRTQRNDSTKLEAQKDLMMINVQFRVSLAKS